MHGDQIRVVCVCVWAGRVVGVCLTAILPLLLWNAFTGKSVDGSL